MKLSYLRRNIVYITVFFIISLFQGCATVAYRFKDIHSDYPLKPYPATKCDLNVIKYVKTEGNGAPWYYIMITHVCVAVDLPFSLLIDTVLLPYDFFDLSTRSGSDNFDKLNSSDSNHK